MQLRNGAIDNDKQHNIKNTIGESVVDGSPANSRIDTSSNKWSYNDKHDHWLMMESIPSQLLKISTVKSIKQTQNIC